MRKKRAIIYDDQEIVLKILEHFFQGLGYEVLMFEEPQACPLYEFQGKCDNDLPCADIIISDFKMPRMNGLELIKGQIEGGCRLDVRNKAIMSGVIDECTERAIRNLGCRFFLKPIAFDTLSSWVAECEKRIDLDLSLGCRRKHVRSPLEMEIQYTIAVTGQVIQGSVVNISEEGLCIISQVPLLNEQRLRIITDLPIPHRDALVRWTRFSNGAHWAGLHCPPYLSPSLEA